MIKMIALSLVVLGCSVTGFMMAGRLNRRVKLIKALMHVAGQLQIQIEYGNIDIVRAIKKTLYAADGDVNEFLLAVLGDAESNTAIPISEIWNKNLMRFGKGDDFSSLTESDMEALKAFGDTLGRTDKTGQRKNFELLNSRLEEALTEASEKSERLGKVYRSAGVLLGLALAVILL